MVQTLFLVAIVLLGACVGSFLNVVVFRLPAGTFFSAGSRSRCPSCGAPIRWFDNLPVVSWLVLLRGRGRCCGAPISGRYPLVELLTAGLFGALFWSTVGHSLPVEPAPGATWPELDTWLAFAFRAWLLAVLIACTFIDIDHRILPDVLTKPTMIVGLVGALLVPGLAGSFRQPPTPFDSLLYSAVGLVAGFCLTAAIRAGATRLFAKEAMGFGDVKFMAAIGAFVGWEGAVVTFFLGCVFGAVYGVLHQWITKEAQIYFGPFLALGAVISLFWRDHILHFVTETWPEWQRGMELPPTIPIAIAITCSVLLVIIIRRGRRH